MPGSVICDDDYPGTKGTKFVAGCAVAISALAFSPVALAITPNPGHVIEHGGYGACNYKLHVLPITGYAGIFHAR